MYRKYMDVWRWSESSKKKKKRKKSSGANKIDRCQNKNKVHALTFEAIDVENAKEMMFMCAIFGSDTASSLYSTSCVHRAHNSTWQVFTEAAKKRVAKRERERAPNKNEYTRINWTDTMNGSREPWSYSDGREEKMYTTFIFIYLFICSVCQISNEFGARVLLPFYSCENLYVYIFPHFFLPLDVVS